MKHQALARVFSVVLAIMCLLMLLNGATGFGKAAKAHEERIAFENKFAQRIENYVTLHEQVENSISYDEAYKLLKEKLEQHDKDAAQHRTDTALYTAEKGGNTMGANLIWEAMPEVEGAKLELATAKQKLETMEALYAEQAGEIASIQAEAGSGASACALASQNLGTAFGKLQALMANPARQPLEDPGDPGEKPDDPGEWTEEPVEKPDMEDPGPFTETKQDPPKEDDYETKDEYDQACVEYRQYEEEYEQREQAHQRTVEEYQEAMAPYLDYEQRHSAWEAQKAACENWEKASAEKAYYDENHERIQAEYEAWEGQLSIAQQSCGFAAMQAGSVLAQQGENLMSLGARAAAVAQAMGVDMPSGMDLGGDMSGMSPGGDMMENIQLLQNALGQMQGVFGAISGGLSSIGGELEKARYMVVVGEEALKKAEAEMHTQLANIWYNLGQLEEKADDLREEKERLDLEALGLDKELMETDELKLLKNRHISARQLLINIPEVKSSYAETEDLEVSARSYLEDYRAETRSLNQGRRLINLLAVLGGVFGVLGIPGAYEKLRGRFWLIAPVLLCLGCAAAADWVNMRLGLGQMYTALFTAIFAVIDLLIILPRKKALPSE